MANISVTYTFTNSTTADASEVNTNFTDIINGTSDGSKDFSINALTVAGAATFNGNVTLGNASSDDLTVTASLASSIPVKTNNAFDIGSTATGLRALYLAEAGGVDTVKLQAGNTSSGGDWTLTLPTGAGTTGYALYDTNGSGTLGWAPLVPAVLSVDNGDSPVAISTTDRVSLIICDTSSGNIEIDLPAAADNDGRIITIKKTSSSNTVTIDPNSTETLDGSSTSQTLSFSKSFVTIVSDGTGWHTAAAFDYVEGKNASAGTSISSVTAINVTSITLTPGIWRVVGMVGVSGTASAVTQIFAAITQTSATLPASSERTDSVSVYMDTVDTSTQDHTVATPEVIYIITSSTTVYLVGRATFPAGTETMYGTMKALRIG